MVLQRDILAPALLALSCCAFAFGTTVGSFLNVLVWRLPRGESIVHPGSHCPKCNHAIRAYENIPILSWLFLRGHCSCCGQSIAIRYPLVEGVTGLTFLLIWWRVWAVGLPIAVFLPYAFLGGALLAATMIDLEHLFIPNEITYAGMVTAVVLAFLFPETHLFGSAPGLPGDDQLILGWILEALSRSPVALPVLSPPMNALLDAATGLLFGYGILRIVLEAGKRLWGELKLTFAEPLAVVISSTALQVGEDYEENWGSMFCRRSDKCRMSLAEAELSLASHDNGATRLFADEIAVTVTKQQLTMGEEAFPLAAIKRLSGSCRECIIPREVMGHGDLKLMAMIGAFLGADSCVFILMIAAFTGCLFGLVRLTSAPSSRQSPIPFGPFLSLGALVWILSGAEFVDWYAGFLQRLG